MSNITTQNRIARQLDYLSNNLPVEGFSLLQHFNDYPEVILFLNDAAIVHEGMKFGKGCAYFPNNNSSITISNNTGMFNLSPLGEYEFECFVKFADKSTELDALGYKFFNGHTFKNLNVSVGLSAAKTNCEELGGHLPTSTSADKNEFLVSILNGSSMCWLNAAKDNEAEEDTWSWGTSEAWNYTNWSDGEPDSENDTYARLKSDGTWEGSEGTGAIGVLCEWDYDMRLQSGNILNLVNYDGYAFFNGHSFKYFNNYLTWSEAKAACEELGGHLATSTSAEKNTFLRSLTTDSFWLGATDEAVEGTWVWVTGETWDYINWVSGQPDNANDNQHYLRLDWNNSSEWCDDTATTQYGYICEWDYDIHGTTDLHFGNINALSVKNGNLTFTSDDWSIEKNSPTALQNNSWYHLLLRIKYGKIFAFIDGIEVFRAWITTSETIAPELIVLGGYVGCMDEFAFRRNAGNDAPTVPTIAYDTGSTETPAPVQNVLGNAPVTRVSWSYDNLPDGLTLSNAGILSGHPTTAGTYDCEFNVSTNWGTDNKTIRIVVTE